MSAKVINCITLELSHPIALTLQELETFMPEDFCTPSLMDLTLDVVAKLALLQLDAS
jgi:hypothetical protein